MIKSMLANILIFIISIIIFFIYQININEINFELIAMEVQNNLLLLVYIIIISIISQYYYENDLSYKTRSKNYFSLYNFKFLSKVVHISTLIIVVNGVLINNFLNLEFHNSLIFRYIGIAFTTIAITLFVSSKIPVLIFFILNDI